MMIRCFEDRDIDAAVRIFNDIVLNEDSFTIEEPISPDDPKTLVRDKRAFYVAVEDNEVVGFYYLNPLFKGRASHIANATYGVTKEYRRRGIGFALGKHSVLLAKELGFRYILFLNVLDTNKGSNRIWEKLGFRKMSSIPCGFRDHSGNLVKTNQYLLDLNSDNPASIQS